MTGLKQKTISGFFWSSAENFSVQGIQFVIQVLMARMLLPSDYGLVAMLAIFMAISQTFVDSGFGNALIRKLDRTNIDYSTVFYYNILVSLILYFTLYFASPYIAEFYKIPVLETLTKIIALNLIISSLSIVQRTKLIIQVDFKTQAKASLIAVLISGIIGVGMAYFGFGVWALVVQSLVNNIINTLILWIYSRWLPIKTFSITSFNAMFSYGLNILMAGLINTIYKNIYTFIIGKKFSTQDLGYYSRADQFAHFPSSTLNCVWARVTYPILSSIQNEESRLLYAYKKYIKLTAFCIFPLMVGLSALARPLIMTVLTSKWEGTIILLQILCFSYMLQPIQAINMIIFKIKGRSDIILRLEIINKIIGISVIFITVPMGITAICIGLIFVSFVSLIVNIYYTSKFIKLSFFQQIKDLIPIFSYAFSMGIIVWFSIQFIHTNILSLFAGIIIGIIYYITITYSTKSSELKDAVKILLMIKSKILK